MPSYTDIFGRLNNLTKWNKNLLGRVKTIETGGTSPYKVYTALLTQNGGDNLVTFTHGDPLTIGVTYRIIANSDNSGDFINVGAPNNIPGTRFVATGTTPTSWGDPFNVELKYNTGAPVVTVLENTIGNIWFTYQAEGVYPISSNDLFTTTKTAIFIGQSDFNSTGIASTTYTDESNINITTYNYNGTLTNSILGTTTLEIRVYN